MKSQSKSIYYISGAILIIVIFFVGFFIGEGRTPASIANRQLSDLNKVSNDDFAPFWKAWQILNERSIFEASTTKEKKIYGAIEGLAASYGDPYTVFFPPVEAKMFAEDIAGSFPGVGMEIGIKNKQLQVVAPIKNSPAFRAGVKSGDYILKIDEKSTVDITTDEAVKLIRGPKGTEVKITFYNPNDKNAKPIEKILIRDTINIPTIESELKTNGIYYIRLYSFTATSQDLFRNALREFYLSGSHKLILDLRGNPGGYLEASWDMASLFLPSGSVVVTEDFGKNEQQRVYYSKGYDVFSGNKGLEMLILVDNGSASASEILAGALQENGVAKLVGMKTYGKGSVQELISLTSDTSLKVTIAGWLTPNGTNLSKNGINPDYPVELNEKNTANGRDPIMEKAVELLSARP